MSGTSKTGLMPSRKKKISMEVQVDKKEATLKVPNFAVPAHFTLRPFAGIYNPFPYRCSVLCNHPADFEAKSMVKKARDVWASEGKSLLDAEEYAALKSQRLEEIEASKLESVNNTDDKISKTLFNNYEGPESMPLTPAPTLASVTTKSSQNLRVRRCFTPDPLFFPGKEKTLLLLDLRRSHSQDTWQGDQLGDSVVLDFSDVLNENFSRGASPKKQKVAEKKKKINKKASESLSRTISSLKTEDSRDSDSKITTQYSSRSQTSSKISSVVDRKNSKNKIEEEIQGSDSSDHEIIKRRGKKKKGKKSGKTGLEGDKEFKGIPDPGETQISALNGESKENSSKASLSEEEKAESIQNDVVTTCIEPYDSDFDDNCKSFLNLPILKQLQRQLDQEVIDSEMNVKKRIALEEALRFKKESKFTQQKEEMKNLKKEFLSTRNLEDWITTPRAFSRQSARFELPLDSRLLNTMTPLEYVQTYIFASAERLILYNRVFNRHKEESEKDDDQDRKLLGKNVIKGLNEIMGKDLTPKQASDFQNLIGWKDEIFLNFRTFVGISAACERLLGPQFCKMLSQTEDPRHRIEIADFETLDEKLLRLKPDRKLVQMLKSFRDL